MDQVRKLHGGVKAMWLREHKEEVLEYLDKHGEEATLVYYNISRKDTLERLVKTGSSKPFRQEFTRMDRIEMKANMAAADLRDSKGKVQELEASYQKFVESVGEQLAVKFFLPLLRLAIKVDPDLVLKPDNRLDLSGLFDEKPLELQSDILITEVASDPEDEFARVEGSCNTPALVDEFASVKNSLHPLAFKAFVHLLCLGERWGQAMKDIWDRVCQARDKAQECGDQEHTAELGNLDQSYLEYFDFFGDPDNESDAHHKKFLVRAAELYAQAEVALGR